MKSYGEFIDSIVEAVKAASNVEATILMEEWMALASPEEWAGYRPMEMNEGLVLGLAEDMIGDLQRIISGISTDELYVSTLKSGHEFLQIIHAKAVEAGVDIDIKLIDQPLTPSEMVMAMQSGGEGQ